ncbi:MAG: hypothetical protein ABJN84_18060 [Flavobacteriaceae bacterium]
MFTTINIILYPKKRKSSNNKLVPIYARITLDSKISDDMEKLKNDPALLEFAKSI